MMTRPPARCQRVNALLWIPILIPAVVIVILAFQGLWLAALTLFGAATAITCWGTLLPQSRLFGPLVRGLPETQATQRGVWITIDDGPDPATTPHLLDILAAHDAKAGFFLIGDKARQYPELVREIAERGHLIGNHSQTHPAAHFWRLRPGQMWREIAGCQQTLKEILGVEPVWFRPPVGHHNPFVRAVLKAMGLTMIMWKCRGFDAVSRDASGILKRLAWGLQPGAIILLHDGTPVAAEVLEGTLRLVKERNLKPVVIESLLVSSKLK